MTKQTGILLFLAIALALAFSSGPQPAAAGACDGAANDNNIWWTGLGHNSFDATYRNPFGAVTTNQGSVHLRFRTCQGDVTGVRVRVWNDRTNSESWHSLAWEFNQSDPGLGTVDFWGVDLPIAVDPTIEYYFFEITDGSDVDYYVDDDPKLYGGGWGEPVDNWDDMRSFQITVYDPAFATPDWMKEAVVYQIFPDRFRDGENGNNPQAGRFSYNRGHGAIVRSQFGTANSNGDWNFTVCDPRSTYTPACQDSDGGFYGDNFYGGDLRGVIHKLEDGYFQSLGITALYLNPIFRSPSNHKYDTADYFRIDPDFGALADFQELTRKAHARGIRVILDGVFNHTSSDSRYFDRYSRYDASGALTSPNAPGVDDNSGACESPASAQRNWYYLPDIGTPGNQSDDRCDANDSDDPSGAWTATYEAWYGYGSLPKLQANTSQVRNLIWADGTNSVGPYWLSQGGDGWRFDVGGDVDPGVTNDPANDYWEGFRDAAHGVKSDALLLGEEWGDASPWLLGHEWDAVMNYRFRSTLLSWLMDGCNAGNGCTGGAKFQDNDNNDASASGPITVITPSQFHARLMAIYEDYPAVAFQSMMNLADSHDTNRVRFLLKKTNFDDDATALQRLKQWWLFAYTYPGAPTLYYGDEIALSQDGVWANGKWEDDPYNRIPYPWPDASGSSYSYNATAQAAGVQAFARIMASIRYGYSALHQGDVQHGLVIDDANKLYGYARTTGSATALILLNRDAATHSATFSGLNAAPYNLPDGTELIDALTGGSYIVSSGAITVNALANWGAILLEKGKIDRPQTPSARISNTGSGMTLTFTPVFTDTMQGRELPVAYEIHRANSVGFTPDASNRIAIIAPGIYGGFMLTYQADAGMTVSYNGESITFSDPAGSSAHTYAIVTQTAAGGKNTLKLASSPTLSIRQTPSPLTLSWPHTTPFTSYQLWRHTSPYFTPETKGALLSTVNAPTGNYTDATAGVIGTPHTNYFYLLRGLQDDAHFLFSNPVGEFDFALIPGS